MEELRPNYFLVRENRARHILKGEGKLDEKTFTLTTWRRDGLLARLRDNGFTVYTLEDRVDALPGLPPPLPIGPEVTRPVNNIERISYFDMLALTWVPVDAVAVEGQKQVTLRAGWLIRRRKGRGEASFYKVFAERTGGAGLTATDETTALMLGYAQARRKRPPLVVQPHGEGWLLPDLELPPPHRSLMERLAERRDGGWYVDNRVADLAGEVYAKLGLELVER
jgi:hypothetical protein